MLLDFQRHIQTHFSDIFGKKLLITLSGGIDSIVLSHLLQTMNFDILLAHCNFQLRGEESLNDEYFVKKFSEENELPIEIKRFETLSLSKQNKKNIQLITRELRYNWFEEIALKKKCDYIVTAHQFDDNAETFFINLLRGTGLTGLTGIPERNGKIIRPLLPFSRKKIQEYAQKNHILWREDSSNSTDKYLRNKIRHHIIPNLKNINNSFENNFKKNQYLLNKNNDFITYEINKYKQLMFKYQKNYTLIDIEQIISHPHSNFIIYKLMQPFGFENITDLKQMLKSHSGKQLFSKTHRILKNRNHWLLSPIKAEDNTNHFIIQKDCKSIEIPIKLEFKNKINYKENDKNNITLNLSPNDFPLILRKWKKNDYFFPNGMNGKKKKVSKFFKDEKFSVFEKENQWILTNQKDEIIWIVGKRFDERFKPLPNNPNNKSVILKHN